MRTEFKTAPPAQFLTVRGPKGDKGETGELGPIGPRGPQGFQGLQGVSGSDGLPGIQGIQGIQGVKGDKGDKGDTGDQGIQGIQGIPGTNGTNGTNGATGPTPVITSAVSSNHSTTVGSKTLTVAANDIPIGAYALLRHTSGRWATGLVTGKGATTLTVNVDAVSVTEATVVSGWTVSLAGAQGAVGPTGPAATTGPDWRAVRTAALALSASSVDVKWCGAAGATDGSSGLIRGGAFAGFTTTDGITFTCTTPGLWLLNAVVGLAPGSGGPNMVVVKNGVNRKYVGGALAGAANTSLEIDYPERFALNDTFKVAVSAGASVNAVVTNDTTSLALTWIKA